MIGLIKKDLLMLKSNLKILVILLFVYGVMAFKEQMDLSFLLPFMSVMIMISTFSYDVYNKWDAYVCTLPNGRKNSVKAKYIATLLLIFITTIIITIIMMIISYMNIGVIDYESILSNVIGSVFATTLIQSFMYPSIYKFGVEKARIGVFIIVFLVVMLGAILSNFIEIESVLQSLVFLEKYMVIILIVIIILMLLISYKISERIYSKKEY